LRGDPVFEQMVQVLRRPAYSDWPVQRVERVLGRVDFWWLGWGYGGGHRAVPYRGSGRRGGCFL